MSAQNFTYPKATRVNAEQVIDMWYTSQRTPKNISTLLGISKKAVVRIIKGQLFADVKRPDTLPAWRYE